MFLAAFQIGNVPAIYSEPVGHLDLREPTLLAEKANPFPESFGDAGHALIVCCSLQSHLSAGADRQKS